MNNSISMTQFAATLADIIGIPAPADADGPISFVKQLLNTQGIDHAQKVLIYNPDAVGMWLFQKYTEWFAPVLAHTQMGIPVCTVLPSVTPVCFGTMYTGVEPAVHGIQKYEKYVLLQESLFDLLGRSGLRTAVVAVHNSSMAILFGGREIDYYIMPYDEQVNDKAEELIAGNSYDVVIVYNQEYDDVMHRTSPESEQALAALRHHIAAFDRLCRACKEGWGGSDTLICWATDHGIHTNADGHGTHGDDLEDDLNVMHFFGAWKGKKTGTECLQGRSSHE